jgi:hypothetical protein
VASVDSYYNAIGGGLGEATGRLRTAVGEPTGSAKSILYALDPAQSQSSPAQDNLTAEVGALAAGTGANLNPPSYCYARAKDTLNGQSGYAKIIDCDNQSDFMRYRLSGDTTTLEVRMYGQYAIGVGVGGGGGQATTYTVDAGAMDYGWQVIGAQSQDGGGWLDWCTWSYDSPGTNQVRIFIHNHSTNFASGTFYFCILAWR